MSAVWTSRTVNQTNSKPQSYTNLPGLSGKEPQVLEHNQSLSPYLLRYPSAKIDDLRPLRPRFRSRNGITRVYQRRRRAAGSGENDYTNVKASPTLYQETPCDALLNPGSRDPCFLRTGRPLLPAPHQAHSRAPRRPPAHRVLHLLPPTRSAVPVLARWACHSFSSLIALIICPIESDCNHRQQRREATIRLNNTKQKH